MMGRSEEGKKGERSEEGKRERKEEEGKGENKGIKDICDCFEPDTVVGPSLHLK